MIKSLFEEEVVTEIKYRIGKLDKDTCKKWGTMDAAQMLEHCNKVLQIATGSIILPKTNFLLKIAGIIAKKELLIFRNGIPRSMPTFSVVKVSSPCDFEQSRMNLLQTLEIFLLMAKNGELPPKHELFGKMSHEDWGFLEYIHFHHHLKQFGI